MTKKGQRSIRHLRYLFTVEICQMAHIVPQFLKTTTTVLQNKPVSLHPQLPRRNSHLQATTQSIWLTMDTTGHTTTPMTQAQTWFPVKETAWTHVHRRVPWAKIVAVVTQPWWTSCRARCLQLRLTHPRRVNEMLYFSTFQRRTQRKCTGELPLPHTLFLD